MQRELEAPVGDPSVTSGAGLCGPSVKPALFGALLSTGLPGSLTVVLAEGRLICQAEWHLLAPCPVFKHFMQTW